MADALDEPMDSRIDSKMLDILWQLYEPPTPDEEFHETVL
jgi:hypothetical protein